MVAVCKRSITTRQAEVLSTIDELTIKLGHPPTFRELAKQLGISSPNGILCHLRSLRAKELVSWDVGCNRTLRCVKPTTGIPILGVCS